EKDLPILVSIGYSACHWCHVMERESFENETTAQYMNEHFVNIKIDREERPDLDHLYMDALQAIAGNGGWPLNVFLTTDAKPFYGGTYFPPEKAFNRISWSDVLQSMTEVWTNKRDEVEEQADRLINHIKKANRFADAKNLIPSTETVSFFNVDDCILMAAQFLKNADTTDGGYGRAPKFLHTFSLQYQLQYGHLFKKKEPVNNALFTLQKMLQGGIYDQLAGGISRYSTDNEWLAPHFEKMLYDNALFAAVLCDAYQLSKQKIFKQGIENTLHFFMHEMKCSEGGYYAALDADSEGEEGKFYVWQKKEIGELLGKDAELFCDFYDVKEGGNWEGKNILNIKIPVDEFVAKNNLDIEEFEQKIAACKLRLIAARNQRTRPGTDDKILLNSNALLLTAFCKAYAALGEEAYKTAAVELYIFIDEKFRDADNTGGLKHTYKNGEARYQAFLDDYAYLIQACIFLQEVTGEQEYLLRAKELTQYVLRHFADEESPFLFYTHKDQQDIIVRKIEMYDGATPSANGIMAQNLFYLGVVFDEKEWLDRGSSMLKSIFNALKKHPASFAVWAGAYLMQTAGILEIAITGREIQPSLERLLEEYIPNKVVQSSTKQWDMPLLRDKNYENDLTIYLCKDYSCSLPLKKISDLLKSLYDTAN
ncbi:MAG: thioredoxin domain-containing protein, partial [Gloeobacteraceae cyanobacterium ES-bin-316]|nr:thioredoxin domain-containing protein [Ferruginibacter sp.]